MLKRILISLLTPIIAVVGTPLFALSAQAATHSNSAPVLFVHGYINNPLCTGGDVSGTFAGAISKLQSRGYAGPTETVAYYACDTNGANIQSSGNPNAYFPSGAWHGGWGTAGGNTNATDIRHISYQLAWYIYDTYSSRGQTVSIVSHSMGGLITRWALYQIQAQNPLFPPYLYVQDSVTISTPHLGTNDGWNNLTWCPGSVQCQQMLPNSTFLNELNANGKNPQATGGTEWTAMGSAKCDIMTAAQSTDMGDVHKVIYNGASSPKCYNHTNYLTDVSDALDMPVQYRNPGDVSLSTSNTGAHSLAWMSNALFRNHPTSSPTPPPPSDPVGDAVQNLLNGLFGKK